MDIKERNNKDWVKLFLVGLVSLVCSIAVCWSFYFLLGFFGYFFGRYGVIEAFFCNYVFWYFAFFLVDKFKEGGIDKEYWLTYFCFSMFWCVLLYLFK